MDREALEQLLTAYTAAEQEYLREGTPDKEVPQPSELLEEEILPPGESIGIVRQDRFRPVGSHKHNYIELNYVWSGGCSKWFREKDCHQSGRNLPDGLGGGTFGRTL